MTVPLHLDAESRDHIRRAAEILVGGGIVAIPTETVYGLAADASQARAVVRIFDAKDRPRDHPLILHVADRDHARACASRWTAAAEVLARAFWPGPLSLLLDRSSTVPVEVTGGRDSVVIRVPACEPTLHLLALVHQAGSIGLAAPSANRFGSVSPTSARHVIDDLGDRIDAVLDGGPCTVGVESTIVDCRGDAAMILRPGGITVERIRSVLAEHGFEMIVDGATGRANGSTGAIAPGMLSSHYATRAPLEIHETQESLDESRRHHQTAGRRYEVLAHPEDDFEYSRGLYASMRDCDARNPDVILALLPPAVGLGVAVRDRLFKAAADR